MHFIFYCNSNQPLSYSIIYLEFVLDSCFFGMHFMAEKCMLLLVDANQVEKEIFAKATKTIISKSDERDGQHTNIGFHDDDVAISLIGPSK